MSGHRFHLLRRPVRRNVALLSLVLMFQVPVSGYAQMGGVPQVPQIPAFLPTVDQVPATQTMPLDGTWLITSIGKKIRIEAGRAFAVDGWTHMFVLNIQPGMVVIKNIVPTGPGAYQAEDLPLLGKWTAKVQRDRSLAVSVATAMMPVTYRLVPIQIDNAQWYAQEMRAAGLTPPANAAPVGTPAYRFTPPGGGGAPPPPQATPAEPAETAGRESEPARECATEQYDPKTDRMVCADGR